MAKSKMTVCKACGQEIAVSATTCPHCGAKNKKPFYKKAWFWVVVVFVLAMGSGDGETATDPTVAETVMETAAQTTLAPIETTTMPTEATEVPTEETTEVTYVSEKASAESIALLIQAMAKDKFTNFEMEYDETGITINIWEDGITTGAMLAASGNSECLQSWNELVNNVAYFGESITELAATLGRDDLIISVNVLNDQNKDNVLIFIMNGIVVYDAVNNA